MFAKVIELFVNSQRNFYFLLAFSLVAILFTHPFLRYPYDVFAHLMEIDNVENITSIQEKRQLWHLLWRKFFYFFSIPNSEIFFRAKIIHILQTYVAFFSIFLFSHVVIRNLFKDIDKTILNYLSLWSVVIWFTIFATFSVHYQIVWTLWYSVNYQITLPLFWYITALTLIVSLEETSIKTKVFFIFQILLISRFILQVHSMEFLYYIMYLVVFSIVYLDKVYYFLKKYYYAAIPLIISIIYFAKKYQPEKSKIFDYLEIDKLPHLYHNIVLQGEKLIAGFNRADASINELMVLIYYLGIIVTLIVLRNKVLNTAHFLDFRKFIFIMITSMFVLVPIYELSAGLLAIVTRTSVVHRFYYSSSLYVLLPVFVYYLWYLKDNKNISIVKINVSLMFLLSSVWVYSKYDTSNQIYYKNVNSIKNSFFERRVGFNLSKQQIDLIGEKIKLYEKKNKTDKENFYYARADISFVIKYIYGKKVLWKGRRVSPKYINIYNKTMRMTKHKKYNLILFDVPKGFPAYQPYR